MSKLPIEYYQQEDVVALGQDLLGKMLFVRDALGQTCGGMIVETESYAGITDRASHAYNDRRTKRTEVMYRTGGVSYIYLCYGMYHLLNIVTGKIDVPHAVLIRAIEPIHGIQLMVQRRKQTKLNRKVAGGPGLVTQALGIGLLDNDLSLTGERIWVEDHAINITSDAIIASPRVGVAYAKEDAERPYRFRIKNSMWTSIAK